MEKFSLIITAGGTSSRFGGENKLLENIKDKTVIEETVNKFIDFPQTDEIIIASNVTIIPKLKELFKDEKIKITEGGKTRQSSVRKALQLVKNDYVIIHDGARPLIEKSVIEKVFTETAVKGAVSVMTKTTDTIKEVDEKGKIIRTVERSKLFNTQTPQAFKTSLIKDAHEKLKDENFTDDSSMLEYFGIPVYIVEGSPKNIKITVKTDLDFAKLYI